jgi:hypothetical protein
MVSLASYLTVLAFAETFQGVNYTIIEKSNLENIKRSINMRLGEKVTKRFLTKLP